MTQIYLTGAVSTKDGEPDWDDPYAWQHQLSDDYEDIDFIKPFYLTQYGFGDDEVYDHPEEIVEPALEKLEASDGLLVRYDEAAKLSGTYMEVRTAYQHGIPVVNWYVGERGNVSPWLLYHQAYQSEDRDQAMKTLLMLAGESAEEVIGI